MKYAIVYHELVLGMVEDLTNSTILKIKKMCIYKLLEKVLIQDMYTGETVLVIDFTK